MRILVVEDQPELNNVIVKQLELENYSVDTCLDGESALDYAALVEYDGIVLDIMLPKISGLDVLKCLRESGKKTPVLLLTAKDSVEDRVKGLDDGADDYLVKPFSFDELLARLRSIIRRNTGDTSNILSLSDLTMDCKARTVERSGTPIELSSKEFSILEYMMHNENIVLTRDSIEEHIWNYDYEGGSNIVDVYIRYLRKKIDENYSPKLIHTIRGTGYVLRAADE